MLILGSVAFTAPFVLISGVQARWCPDRSIARSHTMQGRIAAVLAHVKHWTDEMVIRSH